ncbi:MAG: hypothetical protein K2Y23_05035 [Cyanobacteria bacterium]|nr:hypothetical protein [Cyanobacteriota bacterium]
MTEAVARARQIAKRVLGGEDDPLLACRELADMREELSDVADEVVDVFVAVASEIDDLPIGRERVHWATQSLREKDLEAADYRARVIVQVDEALRRLLETTGHS